jgi:uncharacterized protein Yka (UPF0111/DUF47 family)
MIVQSIHNSIDVIHNQYRNTVYRTLEDPVTRKEIIEIVQYVYTINGQMEQPAKGGNVDKQA